MGIEDGWALAYYLSHDTGGQLEERIKEYLKDRVGRVHAVQDAATSFAGKLLSPVNVRSLI